MEEIENEFEKTETPIKENICKSCNKKFQTKKQLELHYLANHKRRISDKDLYVKEIKELEKKESPQNHSSSVFKFLKETFKNDDDTPHVIENKNNNQNEKLSKLKKFLTPNYTMKESPTCQSNLRYRYYLNSPNNYNNSYQRYNIDRSGTNNNSGGYSV